MLIEFVLSLKALFARGAFVNHETDAMNLLQMPPHLITSGFDVAHHAFGVSRIGDCYP